MPRRLRGETPSDLTRGYPIPQEIEISEFRSFCFTLPENPAYHDAFWKQMEMLTYWHSWEHPLMTGARDYRAKEVAAWWAENVYLPNREAFEFRGDDCAPHEPVKSEGDCVAFPPINQYVQFSPTDPYKGKTDVSPGYVVNPWKVAKDNTILGIQKGDVYADVDSLMTGMNLISYVPRMLMRLANGGFPKMTITFEGKGELELHLINLPLGGMYLIHEVGTGLDAKIVLGSTADLDDLFSWLDSLALLFGLIVSGGLVQENIVELTFEEDKTHVIEITLLPRINFPNILQVGWGGGIRKIVACGGKLKGVPKSPPIIRPGNGELEYKDPESGEWLPVPESGYIMDDCGCCDDSDLDEDCEDC